MRTQLHKLTAAVCALALLLSLAPPMIPTAFAASEPVKSKNINAQDYDGKNGLTSTTTKVSNTSGTTTIVNSLYQTTNYWGAIAADGALRSWYRSNMGKPDYSVITIGANYLSINATHCLKSDGTLWQGLGANYSSESSLTKIADNVKQVADDGSYLKNDGTVYNTLDTYITDDARQIYSTGDFNQTCLYILKNDNSLWSYSLSCETTGNPLLGRENAATPDHLGKIMDDVAYVTGGMAIKMDNSLWSWGLERTVGDGSAEASSVPVKIMDNVVGAWSSTGSKQRFALTASGDLYSWGVNYHNNLGYEGGDKTSDTLDRPETDRTWSSIWQSTPRKVSITNVAAVYNYDGLSTEILKQDGSLWSIGAGGASNEENAAFRKIMDGVKVPEPIPAPSAPPAPAPVQFTDVTASHWASDAIQLCADNGIVTGFGDGSFLPDDPVTGIQFIVMLTRAFYSDQVEAVEKAKPADAPWYWPYTYAAEALRVSAKVPASNEAMNRYDMSRAVVNVLYNEVEDKINKVNNRLNPVFAATLNVIKDWDYIPSNYQGTVYFSYALGIFTGMSDGMFHGDQTITRAQACVVIQRMMELING